MTPDRMILSAYLDGEVPERFVPDIESAIQNDPKVRREYEELSALRDRLISAPLPNVPDSAERAWLSIRRRVVTIRPNALWRRELRLPVSAVAAAGIVLIGAVALMVWSLLPGQDAPAEKYLANSTGVDVTIRVDGNEMEDVLQWLANKDMLGEINIQLPEQQFELMGESVLLKPDQDGGRIIE